MRPIRSFHNLTGVRIVRLIAPGEIGLMLQEDRKRPGEAGAMTTAPPRAETIVGEKTYRLDGGGGHVTSTVFTPVKEAAGYACRISIRWPDRVETDVCLGSDCLHAMIVAMERAHRLIAETLHPRRAIPL